MSAKGDIYSAESPPYSSFFGIIGASFSMTMAAAGSAYATAKAGTGIAGMAQVAPRAVMKSLIPVVMAGFSLFFFIFLCLEKKLLWN